MTQPSRDFPFTPAGVLFDMDGVLTSNNVFHRQAWQEVALSHMNLTLTEHDLDTKVDGGRNPEIMQRLTGRAPTPEEALRFHNAKEERYRALARGALREVDGLSGYLGALAERGIPYALVTSADKVNVEFGLEALGLAHRFPLRIMGEDVTRGKPHPEPFERGAALLGLNPAACLAHEDAVNGVKSAAGAGCTVVALSTTQTGAALLAAGAVRVVADFTGWRSWLK
ncbi:haloacid dehalogenase [Deinococcus irradiatisoli]|uniref:Haloacid dehalogenase n=1 Tax=Deinococcus irradiatisoli TaxID=2202254 RepID=A0A2Z3JIS1_9DEIO|nr:HAD family phosphatase [Deinococcus irradiatisoli]AWN23501.1 haloacid dehalogenase [Deinococcus irradiatisoli]